MQEHTVFIDGVEVGRVDPELTIKPRTIVGPVRVNLNFRPDWVGLFKLVALMAEEKK